MKRSTSLVISAVLSASIGFGHGPSMADGGQILLLSLIFNNRDAGVIATHIDHNGQLMVRPSDLQRESVHIPESATIITLGDVDFVAAKDIPGLTTHYDENASTLTVNCNADCFNRSTVSLKEFETTASAALSTSFLTHYDLFFQKSEHETAVATGLLENVLSTAYGRLQNSAIFRLSNASDLIRLESAWVYEWPDQRTRLLIGDSATRANDWSVPVRFGGIKFGTDFSLQPGFIAFPTPSISGSAALPSTVQLYVNDMQRYEGELPAGPFSLTDLPVITGDGQARLVITDSLGREQVITESFYASPLLLRQGLSDYAVEIGALRHDFGRKSANYGDVFASATWRRGINNNFTLDIHAEALEDFRVAGSGGTWALGQAGIVSANVAVSHENNGSLGIRGQMAYDLLVGQWSWSANIALASKKFRQLGYEDGEGVSRQFRARMGLPITKRGSASVFFADDAYHAGPNIRTLGISYSVAIGDKLYLTTSASQLFRPSREHTIGLYLSMPLNDGIVTGASANTGGNATFGSVYAQKSPNPNRPIGYRAHATVGDIERYEAHLLANTPYVEFEAAASHAYGTNSARLSARGSLAIHDHDFYFARRVYNSYAVVDIPGAENVGVYLDNRYMGTTDRNGKLFLPDLRAYEINRVRVDIRDLPLTMGLSDREQHITPRPQSGMTVRFGETTTYGGLIRLIGKDGHSLAIGTALHINGETAQSIVGSNGRAHISSKTPEIVIEAEDKGIPCRATITLGNTLRNLIEAETVQCSPAL